MEDDRMKHLNPNQMVDEAILEIEKFAPRNSEIEIDLKEDPVGHFQTNIKLRTRMKTFFVKKADTLIYSSFSKAITAMKKKLRRKKSQHLHRQTALKDLSL